jgi:transcriptional regulator with XRE-family HTH domain
MVMDRGEVYLPRGGQMAKEKPSKKPVVTAVKAEKIRILLIKRGTKMTDLAMLLGIAPQSLSRKMKADSFDLADMEKIAKWAKVEYAETFSCTFTLKDTGEEI